MIDDRWNVVRVSSRAEKADPSSGVVARGQAIELRQ